MNFIAGGFTLRTANTLANFFVLATAVSVLPFSRKPEVDDPARRLECEFHLLPKKAFDSAGVSPLHYPAKCLQL